MRQLVQFIHHQEITCPKQQIKDKQVIFDGTTHVCEALVILFQMNSKAASSLANVLTKE